MYVKQSYIWSASQIIIAMNFQRDPGSWDGETLGSKRAQGDFLQAAGR